VDTASLASAEQFAAEDASQLGPAEQSLFTLILLASPPSEWSQAGQQLQGSGGVFTLDSIIANLPAGVQQALLDQQLSSGLVQPIVQTMVAMIQQSAQDSVLAAQLEHTVQVGGEADACALGGGGLITWSDGSFAGCVNG
jgi:hypothetical protein